ncbi:MAG TPA: tRNA (adenosine(37)-N6)-threonylcarbamoyltransferase complex ATPase subunit type 1 TsaE [Candidatus Saccharimonadales bacterium]|nr:tRNA (adenosine(37)-N6)-threonylcarbamoyltransferase complex ATPase subunit type 1 TsaE [Candidatus Saccharimonadales bacterium]
MIFRVATVEDTKAIAAAIGAVVRGGEVFEFKSDLGGGKTAFVKGLARGMGVKNVVQSPSFTISFVHQAGDLELHHFDFYRLDEPGIVKAELAESLEQPNAVVAIEWGQTVHDILPKNRLVSVTIKNAANSARIITIDAPQDYIKEALEYIKS